METQYNPENESPRTNLSEIKSAVEKLKKSVGQIIVGQQQMLELLIAGLLADGHVLIEGVPGVAKTLIAKLLAKSIDADFSRIQFTPDLMPSDVLGTSVFHPQKASFEFKKGPIFGNIILIDEINRAPAKTQAALFEAMEERQITFDGNTYTLSAPFMVMATQNPIEQEGTYRLPEAQLDRFLFKIEVGYPTKEEETQILKTLHKGNRSTEIENIESVLTIDQILAARKIIREIHVEDKLLDFVASIVHETRNNKSIYLGASPRASLAIIASAKAIAAINGRDFVTPDDIVFVSIPVLRHRIMLTPDREMEGITTDEVIKQIIHKTEVPR
jgi:MoxR-like ATPase